MIFVFTLLGVIFRSNIRKAYYGYDKKAYAYKMEVYESYESSNDDSTDKRLYYKPTYYYLINGKEYECESKIAEEDEPKTEDNLVYYKSSDPKICMTQYEDKSRYFTISVIAELVFGIIISFMSIKIIKLVKKMKLIKELNENGKLIKNIPYRLINTGISKNNKNIYSPVISLKNTNGQIIELVGDPRFDYIDSDNDNLVDLLIDINNPKNFFIDFEINRLSGSTAQDYYYEDMVIDNLDENSNFYSYLQDNKRVEKLQSIEAEITKSFANKYNVISLIFKIPITIILILFIIFNSSFIVERFKYISYKTTEGTLIETKDCVQNEKCNYKYLYKVDNKEYTISQESFMKAENPKIYYKKNNPKKAVIASSDSLIFNFICIIVPILIIIFMFRKKVDKLNFFIYYN